MSENTSHDLKSFNPEALRFLLKCVDKEQRLNSMFIVAALVAGSPTKELILTDENIRSAFKDLVDENGDIVAIDIEVSRIVVKNPGSDDPVPALKIAVKEVVPEQEAIVDAEFTEVPVKDIPTEESPAESPKDTPDAVAPVDELAAMRAKAATKNLGDAADVVDTTPGLAKILLAEANKEQE